MFTRLMAGIAGLMVGLSEAMRGKTDRTEYKGYTIQAAPYQLAESLEWEINLYIQRDHGDHVNDKKFSALDSYPTRDEAVRHCLQFGRQIIDGHHNDCSVKDL